MSRYFETERGQGGSQEASGGRQAYNSQESSSKEKWLQKSRGTPWTGALNYIILLALTCTYTCVFPW